ncbi:hypothetical protein Tco_0867371, partial [Tanacetum coccineum]
MFQSRYTPSICHRRMRCSGGGAATACCCLTHCSDDEDDDMDIEADDDEEEEEHPPLADSVVVALPAADQAPFAEETEPFETDESAATPPPHLAYRVTARISIPAPVPTPVWSDAEVARLLAISTPPSSPLSPWSSPLPHIPSPPLPLIPSPPLLVSSPVPGVSPSPPASPIRPLGYRAAMIRLRAEAASTSHSLPLPPPIILSHTRPAAQSSRTPPLHLLFIDRREGRPEVTLPPRKRLGIALGPAYKVGESSSARPAGGLRSDYGFVATMDREIRRDPERDVGYGITDSWDEIVETLQGAPVSTDMELGRHMTTFKTRVRQDTDEIYTRLDDEQSGRQLLAVYLLYGSAGVRVITAAGGRSYKENSRFKRKVATAPHCYLSAATWHHDFGGVTKEKLKATRHRQKSYADNRRKPLEFEVGDYVMLKVSHWKGVVHFGKKGKLAPRYVGPYREILRGLALKLNRLRFWEGGGELIGVHDTFHVSNLKKCLGNANLHVPLNEIKIDKTLRFVEEPVEIMDREVKSLKRSRKPHVKVRWNLKQMVDVSKDGDGMFSQPSEVGAGETLRSSFASKIRNVDGKILGKDGKPMRRAIRQEHVRVSDQIASDH